MAGEFYHQFYLTLPSNSSMKYYPKNTAANFVTHLPRSIHLDGGQWEMALVEVHYPCSFVTVNDEQYIYVYVQDKGHTPTNPKTKLVAVKVDVGDYRTVEDLEKTLNHNQTLKDYVTFMYEPKSKTMELAIRTPVDQIELSPTLALQLGYDPNETDLLHNKKAIRPANLRLGLPSHMYVYCDLVEPQLVGDTVAPLLKIVNIDVSSFEYGAQKTVLYTNPHYVPLVKSTFENVEIDLRGDTGLHLPFQFGTTCVTLHFRRAQQQQQQRQ